jgi:hypothetical protein
MASEEVSESNPHAAHAPAAPRTSGDPFRAMVNKAVMISSLVDCPDVGSFRENIKPFLKMFLKMGVVQGIHRGMPGVFSDSPKYASRDARNDVKRQE